MGVSIQQEVSAIVGRVLESRDITHVVWVAAGGSFGGFHAANYFMERESKAIFSSTFTSNEFVLAPPAYVDEHTLAVICSMRGTKETCEAARTAKELGAATIALYVEQSDLTAVCDQKIAYESIALDESRVERVNSSIALQIAMALVNQLEGYAEYETAMAAFDVVDAVYRKAVAYARPLAHCWAEQMAGEKTIYVMGSGPAYGSAYIFSICNIEEMLQIDSPTINCCEFFHGPFEVLDKSKPVFLLMSVGRCRKADERALAFLERYGGCNVYVLDGKEIGLNDLPDSVSEYFNHILFSPILNNVYMRALSKATSKDYMTRRYMWKVEY
ncbi:Fructoselysine-6-P-deglycase FrlB with duplicated sugar isomerase (SIS) domain [Parafannyhessea umbonata]|uniref:Fructoselysine-6-P-deglycase FrlB with duplicated sugar isomerase (SIS) domain n=1 Tax=Parafannyhessea umbonata TaxID=604330 RepID=A0A1H9PZ72_9ACTN|nr:Fructoselysine-6-P-deglycase FrlB with duplicated sugar isomerase (SIS) domain [Parafannyhessea umbonata]